jgi:hypothetical protein
MQVLGDQLRLSAVAQDFLALVLQSATFQRRLALQQVKQLQYVGGIGHSVVVSIHVLAVPGSVSTKDDVLHVSPPWLSEQVNVAQRSNSGDEAANVGELQPLRKILA